MAEPRFGERALGRLWRGTALEAGSGLDALLAQANPRDPFPDRLRWLARLTHWVSDSSREPAEGAAARPGPAARLRLVFQVLDRNPAVKTSFALTVRSIVREVDALELYCETGLPKEAAFWGEAAERLLLKLVPANPYRAELGTVLHTLFPDERSAAWLRQLDAETLRRTGALIAFEAAPQDAEWNALGRDMPHAILCLVGDVRSIGLSSVIRKRLGGVPFRELPFFEVTRLAEAAIEARRAGGPAFVEASSRFLETLAACAACADRVQSHLDVFGVSVKVVYLLERMRAQIRRVQRLFELWGHEGEGGAAVPFLLALLHDNLHQASVSGLAGDSLRLLAARITDRSAETGEHYIARTREHYRGMLRAAARGGALTALTTWAKFAVLSLGLAPFVQGVLAAVNYSVSFVAIQLLHGTLATKQPAMTAPALARRLEGADTPAGLQALTDEVVHLLRSQAAAVLGNVGVVAPCVLLLGALRLIVVGTPLIDKDEAHHTIEHLSILGGTVFYAALTGVLLFGSSLAAGWADNWFVLRSVGDGIANSPRLLFLLGRRRAARVAAWLGENMALLAGNVSLGVLLGLTPEIGRFLGLPLDVRHVTLSSGQLAAAVGALGPAVLDDRAFWLAVVGIAVIGFANVGVSFYCALRLAMGATGMERPRRGAVRREVLRRFRSRPLSFFYPEKRALDGAGTEKPHDEHRA